MRVLVLQHIAVEHPGIFRDFFAEDGIDWDAVELDDGAAIPDFDGYDILMAMGGPMDVWEDAVHPWLRPEKQAIRNWVEADRPFLGFCLGHQLLADAFGGQVGLIPVPEVGIMDIELTDDGVCDPLFAGLPRRGQCMQWHSAGVLEPPSGAAVLAGSDACPVQAIRLGRVAYGLQYHVEVTGDTAGEWGCVPAYAESLEAVKGTGSLSRLSRDMASALPALNRSARTIYENFMALAREG
ncbi:MAG: type 1 glutamine amidotransferase [Alphaproteobacteria bacterium]|nr:type 1 glutamine amidotransferase [Alphaproteobacteria bacterium]